MSGIFGGRSSSTATNTSSQQYDNRSVVDAGGGIAGSGNYWDASSDYSYQAFTADNSQKFTDNSDRRQTSTVTNTADNSQRFTDNSDRRIDASQSFTDWSNRSVTNTADNSQRFTDNSDRSQRTSFTDSSDRRVDASQSFTDSSDRSQRFTDSSDRRVDASQSFTDWSNRSVSTTTSNDNRVNISTDGGAFDLVRSVADGITMIGRDQISYARDLAERADTMGQSATDFAIRSQEAAAGFADQTAGRAFDLAQSSAAQAFSSSGEALGFTRDTFAGVLDLARQSMQQAGLQAQEASTTAGSAYAAASNTASGNKTLIFAAIGAIALVGVAMAFRKG